MPYKEIREVSREENSQLEIKALYVRIPADVHRDIKVYSAIHGVEIQDFVRVALISYIDDVKNEKVKPQKIEIIES
jgi:hypothetical protein